MEAKNQVTSSFTNDLFGSKDSSDSSSSNSIFGPSSKVFGRKSMGHQFFGNMQDPANYVWNAKSGAPEGNKEWESEKQEKKESPFFYKEKVQPCHLCSSLYYGGQDFFTSSQNSAYSTVTLKKDGGEDDADSALRGNWWQGGLYY